MKFIVTHTSPDLDAIASIWLIKRFLPDWADAEVKFVQAGEKSSKLKVKNSKLSGPVESDGEDQYLHVDTGLGLLDHHQTEDQTISAASLTWEFIKSQKSFRPELRARAIVKSQNEEIKERWRLREEAVERMIKFVVETDHFLEVYWPQTINDRYEFMLTEIIEGLKLVRPDDDEYYLDFGLQALDAIYHNFENRVSAEKEIKEKGDKFKTSYGPGIGFETLNDSVLKLAQRMGYVIAVRKDPRKGYVRVKARPSLTQNSRHQTQNKGVDLTLAYEKLKKMDPDATWFLHVSRKMLLNGTTKNPNMKPTTLTLKQIIEVLEKI